MKRSIRKIFRNFFVRSYKEIDPDEILLEAKNMPGFDTYQLEGRIISSISSKIVLVFGLIFGLLLLFYLFRIWNLQIVKGEKYFEISQNNHLRSTPIFAQRGIIYDRNGEELAWNEKGDDEFFKRKYADTEGIAHVLGFVKYPSKDKFGFYYRDDYEGKDGIEMFFDNELKGKNGTKIMEVNALQKVVSSNLVEEPQRGKDMHLSIDSKLSEALYQSMKNVSADVGFKGGSAVVMDIYTGEIIAMSNYPEYSSNVMTEGVDTKKISEYSNDTSKPFLNKVIQGAYTPGSIVKLFLSVAALNEKVITPDEKIISTGSISVPNEYYPDQKSIFKDWKAHGAVDMRRALAVSSNVYFYEVGGGYNGRKGLGIIRIHDYFQKFGFGESIKIPFFEGASGVIPSPEWKAENFDGDPWRLGDTYHTSIGQYGFQVTPIQVARGVATIASQGIMVKPTIIKIDQIENYDPIDKELDIPKEYFKVVKEGMRLAVTEGTAQGLNLPFVKIGAKSGTAELGISKKKVNSWVTGFFPYDNPKYVFAMVLEEGPVENLRGAGSTMNGVFHWINENAAQYFK